VGGGRVGGGLGGRGHTGVAALLGLRVARVRGLRKYSK